MGHGIAVAEDTQQLVQYLAETWDRAEHAIEVARSIDDMLVVPAVDELRRSGRQVIDALQHSAELEELEIFDRLLTAITAVARARQNALDATFSFVSRKLDDLIPEVLRHNPTVSASTQEAIASTATLRKELEHINADRRSTDIAPKEQWLDRELERLSYALVESYERLSHSEEWLNAERGGC